jgi:hypothetical protein
MMICCYYKKGDATKTPVSFFSSHTFLDALGMADM